MYQIRLTSEAGCVVLDSVTVFVDDQIRVYAPNIFSPNGDGVNDVFYLQSDMDYEIDVFRVFDRWGGLVFENSNGRVNDSGFGWSPLAVESPATGVYIWMAHIVIPSGETLILSGDIFVSK